MTKAELEARRLEAAERRASKQCSVANPDLDKALRWYIKIGFEDGFSEAAALLQGEMERLKKEVNKFDDEARRFSELRLEETTSLITQLQSANAKLAVSEKDAARLEWMIENGHFNPLKVIGLKWIAETPYLCTERFETPREAIDAALDASEGKGKE